MHIFECGSPLHVQLFGRRSSFHTKMIGQGSHLPATE